MATTKAEKTTCEEKWQQNSLTHEFQRLSYYLLPLEGATIITACAVKGDDGEVWPVLTVKTKDGDSLQLKISRDPERNGPGFIVGIRAKRRETTAFPGENRGIIRQGGKG